MKRYDASSLVLRDDGSIVMYSDAEAEIKKARREGRAEMARIGYPGEQAIRADERKRIVRYLDDEGFEQAAHRLHLKFHPDPSQEPKPLEKLGITQWGSSLAEPFNALVDAVNELRARK